jgi:hypothetical protein
MMFDSLCLSFCEVEKGLPGEGKPRHYIVATSRLVAEAIPNHFVD